MSARPQIKPAYSDAPVDDDRIGDDRQEAARTRHSESGSTWGYPRRSARRASGACRAWGPQGSGPKSRPVGIRGDQPHARVLRRARGGKADRRHRTTRGYRLAWAGHQVRFGPIAFWTVVGALVIMAAWSIATASYFAFKDEVVTRLIVREVDLQAAYEDRLAEMRTRVDRVITRQVLDQEQVDQKLEQAMRRQSVLEQRAAALNALGEPGAAGSAKPNLRQSSAEGTTEKPSRETAGRKRAKDRHSGLDPRAGPAASPAADAEINGKIARLMSSLDRVEQRQLASLSQMDEGLELKIRRLRSLLAEIGINPGRGADSGTGGPYVPVKAAGSFEQQIHRVQLARAQLDRLNKTLLALPISRPVSGQIDMSSTFGLRLDPFIGRPAFHTGIDFRGEIGEAVRATGSGTVVSADWSGGYGRMVEIDHGHGLTTRYGHLSNIVVQVGQMVKVGQVVGRMGSTGRSTGPHLHYETRVDGEAVDPQRFLRAGMRMGSL